MNKLLRYSFMFLLTLVTGWAIAGQLKSAPASEGWKFTLNTPAEGKVDQIYQITLNEPAGTMWVDETGAMPCKLVCSDGTEYTYNMGDNYSQQVSGTPLPLGSAEIIAPGTYTLTIPAGTFHINGVGNEAQTFTWTIGDGNEEQKSPYTLTYDKAGELLKLTKEGCTSYETTYLGGASLEGYEGWFSFNPADPGWTMMGNTCIAAYVALGDGNYTLKVQAGTYKFDGVENEAFEIKFTVGENTGGGDGGDFDGEKWQEVLFEAGETSVTIPYAVETEGLSIKTEGRAFMDTNIDVAFNTYGEKELDWNNGTKLIITAKDNISGIVMEGQYISFASADKGTYTNGAWKGALMKGETLTLTANDGILIKKITVLYNGDELKIEEQQEEDGKITLAWPVNNQVLASIAQGGKLCEFTTNKDYAQVTISLKNNNPLYASHDLQTRMYDGQVIGSGVAKDITHNVTTAVPDEKRFYLFKGDSYTLTLKGFVNMWDVQTDTYDAITEINIVGDGIEHEPLSAVELVSITPSGTPLEPGQLAINGGKITLEFSGAVTSVKAVNARGMEGSTTYNGTAVAGKDNKVWEITLGDLSSLASGETESIIFNLNITATAADGAVVFDETKDDFRLEAAWTLVEGEPEPVISLGTPVISVAEGAEIEATDAITIAFPNTENVEEGCTFKVYATVFGMDMSSIVANGEGASPVTLGAVLEAGKGYNLAITQVDIMKGTELVKSFQELPYNVNFTTAEASTDGQNLDFAEGVVGDVNIATYAKDGEVNQMQEVPGWSFGVENGDARAAGVVAYGSATTLGGSTYTVPAAGPEGTNGNALAMVGVWTGTVQYVQDVELPAGKYTMTVPVYNTVGTNAFVKNLIGVKYGETEVYATAKSYPVGKWTNEIVTFELEQDATVTLSVGYEGANCGSAASQHLFIDRIDIAAYDELAVAKTAAIAALPAAGEGIFANSAEEVEAAQAAIEAATTVEEVEAVALPAVAALEGEWIVFNATAQNYLGINEANVVLAADQVNVTFEKAEGGFYIKAGEYYINMRGDNNWSMSADAEAKTAWNFAKTGDNYTISGPKGMIGTDNVDAGSICYGDKNAEKNGLWIIEVAPTTDPIDMTDKIINPQFQDALNGWTLDKIATTETGGDPSTGVKGPDDNKVITAFNTTFDCQQTIEGLEAGWYKLSVQAFARPTAQSNTQKMEDNPAAFAEHTNIIYANDAQKHAMLITEDGSMTEISGFLKLNSGLWVPTSSKTTSAAFSQGLYDQSLLFQVAEDGKAVIGIKGEIVADGGSYYAFDNFRLTRVFVADAEDVEALMAAVPEGAMDAQVKAAMDAAVEALGAKASINNFLAAEEAVAAAKVSAAEYAAVKAIMDSEAAKAEKLEVSAEYAAAIAEVSAAYENGSIEDIEAAEKVVKAAVVKAYCADMEAGADLTALLNNTTFDNNDMNGWDVEGGLTSKNHVARSFEQNYDASQTIVGLPAGTYKVQIQLFGRGMSNNDMIAALKAGEELPSNNTYLYANNVEVAANQITSESVEEKGAGNWTEMPDGTWIPDNAAATEVVFEAGLYMQELLVEVGEDGILKLGVKMGGDHAGRYSGLDNLKLFYFGDPAEMFMAEYESLQQQFTMVYNTTINNKEYADEKYAEVIEEMTTNLSAVQQNMAVLQTWAEESMEAGTLASDLEEILGSFEGIQIQLTQFLNSFNEAIAAIEDEPVEIALTQDMFKQWDGTGADANVVADVNDCVLNLNNSTDCVYGWSNLDDLRYADLSAYEALVITYTDGFPRIMMNRVDGAFITISEQASTEYYTVNENADGSKTAIVNLKKFVEGKGYAHLNSIKASAYNTQVTVTKMILTKGAEEETVDVEIAFDVENGAEIDLAETMSIHATVTAEGVAPEDELYVEGVIYGMDGTQTPIVAFTDFEDGLEISLAHMNAGNYKIEITKVAFGEIVDVDEETYMPIFKNQVVAEEGESLASLIFSIAGNSEPATIEIAEVQVNGTEIRVICPVGTDLGDNYTEKPYIMAGEQKIEIKEYVVDNTTGDFFDPLNLIIITLNEELAAGDYTVVIPAGAFIVNQGENNAEATANFTISAPDAIQGIDMAAKNGKYMQNGKVVIVKNGKTYNVAGQQTK